MGSSRRYSLLEGANDIAVRHVQLNLNSLNTDGSFTRTMANSNSFFESLRNYSDSSIKQTFWEMFLFYHEIVCCVYSLESPRRGDSNEYTQRTIIVEKIKKSLLSSFAA